MGGWGRGRWEGGGRGRWDGGGEREEVGGRGEEGGGRGEEEGRRGEEGGKVIWHAICRAIFTHSTSTEEVHDLIGGSVGGVLD